jgi:hypothetical protein
MEEDQLMKLDLEMIMLWIEDAPKKKSLKMLISTLKTL